jgi:hypothetical protein
MDLVMLSLTTAVLQRFSFRFLLNMALCCMVATLSASLPVSADAAAAKGGIRVVNYVTWWSLDPSGYHPTILLKVENASGRDLTAQLIRFQGRFMDLRTTMVTVARDQQQRQFVPRQQLLVWLRGPEAFELGMNANQWPNMECKAMVRIGDVDDGGTQTLVITNVDRVVMSDDDARQQLEKLREYTQSVSSGQFDEESFSDPEAAMKASASKFKLSRPQDKSSSPAAFLAEKKLPGLGSDFHLFEQSFGLPTSVETNNPGWTWAYFQHPNPHFTVYAGSRGRTGKVDALVVTVPGANALDDFHLTGAARNLSGVFRNSKLGRLQHSVRYLPSGRTHTAQAAAIGYRLSYVSSGASRQDGISLLLISRLPGSPEAFLAEQAKKSAMLKPLAKFFAF